MLTLNSSISPPPPLLPATRTHGSASYNRRMFPNCTVCGRRETSRRVHDKGKNSAPLLTWYLLHHQEKKGGCNGPEGTWEGDGKKRSREKAQQYYACKKWTRSTQSLLIFPSLLFTPLIYRITSRHIEHICLGTNPNHPNPTNQPDGDDQTGLQDSKQHIYNNSPPSPPSLSHLPISLSAIFHSRVSSAPDRPVLSPKQDGKKKKRQERNRNEL